MLIRRGADDGKPAKPTASDAQSAAPAASPEEKVDALVEQAQRAMRDRHFIEPAEGSALR
jgi:hypothetical protein